MGGIVYLLVSLQSLSSRKPEIVHHVGLKTILWGTLAAKWAKVHGVVNAVSGLGIIFSEEKRTMIAKLLPAVLRFSHHRKNWLLFSE